MKRFLIIPTLILIPAPCWAAFTEFYCNPSTGSNVNAGSTEGSPVYSETGGTFVASTRVFTALDSLDLSGVSVGMWMAGYTDGGTVATWVGRITAVNDTTNTITVDATAKVGTYGDLTGNCSVNVGGAWLGPSGAVAFPVGFVTGALVDSSGNVTRVNFKNNATYNISSGLTANGGGTLVWQGYTTTPGDGGKCLIDGNQSGAGITILTISAGSQEFTDIRVSNSGATSGTGTYGFLLSNTSNILLNRCVAFEIREGGFGWATSNNHSIAVECEAYSCNEGNTTNLGGFFVNATHRVTLRRCISHDNTASTAANGAGFVIGAPTALEDCIADTNSGPGIRCSSTLMSVESCDFYDNGGAGIEVTSSAGAVLTIENSNFISNGTYGINNSSNNARIGFIKNCGYGAGTMINTSGDTNGSLLPPESGKVTYASNAIPWVDAPNGNFKINLAAAKGAGIGSYTQTAPSYTGTVGYQDIGAAQHQETGSGYSRGRVVND
jgi:Right handed beta helix region